MQRRSYAGGANILRLAAGFTHGDPTLTTDAPINWPDGAGGPFSIRVAKGLPNEEKYLISSRTGSTFTIATPGYDGTAFQDHSANETVELVGTSIDLDEANAHHMASDGIHGLASGVHVVGDTSVQTLRGKTIDGSLNTLQNIPRTASPQIDAKLTALDAKDATQDTAIAAKVPLAGGTMTGPLVLSADPAVALGAASKQYVDAETTARGTAVTAEATARASADNLLLPIASGTATDMTVRPAVAADKALIVKAQASQVGNLTEYQDSGGTALATVDKAGNAKYPNLPFAEAAGTAALGTINAGSSNAGTITFPSGRFSQPPIVTGSIENNGLCFVMFLNITKDGCDFRACNAGAVTTGTGTMRWSARQMTSGSGSG